MLNPLKMAGGLAPEQRNVVAAVAVGAVALLTLTASYNYVIADMLQGLNASDNQTDMARQIPSIGALLVIFVAGVIGTRVGARRVMVVCGVLYTVGSVIIAVAPVMQVATLGLLLASIGKSAVFVVGLAYMSAKISDPDGRATAFATFSAVSPIAFLVMPILAAVLIDNTSWRWVAVVWAVSGAVGTLAMRRMLPADKAGESSGELVTPALAGLMLAALAQLITLVPNDGWTSRAFISLGVALGALLALVIAMRRMTKPSLSLAPLRHGGLVLLLIVLILTLLANLWFYMTLGLQYIYGLTTMQVALAMVPSQIFTIGGAALAGRLLQRRGITLTGTVLLAVTALGLLASAQMQLDTPIWVAMLIMCVYASAAIGAGVALTNAIMNLAPAAEAGSAASYRSAASNLGSAVGVALMTAVVFGAAGSSLHDQAVASGMDPTTVTSVAKDMRGGATSEEASSQFAVPVEEVDQIDDMQRVAYMEGFQAQGWVGGAVTLLAALLFFVIRRRQEAGVFARAPEDEVASTS
ncbi:MAG: MFS transporter [Candidatus Nanopelagicales bacterium]